MRTCSTSCVGRSRVELGDGQTFDLEARDVLWYEGTVPHRWTQIGDETTELLCTHARPGGHDTGHGTDPR